MVLFSEQETSFLKSFAIEVVGVFEDLAHRVNCDVLSEDVLTLPLDRLDVVTVSKLQGLTQLKQLK